ncbi:hypothetical protein BFJ63_vAg809 [Fusarium oxysporum f. sp. narcissi]|uniref:Uncharacterized protein n=2 Tax=Fusarium oxysporum TaxID=5507 RepID=A0A4Q2W8Z6_FUSOX|nr:hypothetical protein BFJ63_vAg809 [Fusarium oxysporum f. sp. narcissi]
MASIAWHQIYQQPHYHATTPSVMPRHSLLNASSYGKVAPSAHSPASLDKRWGSHANLAIASIDKGRHHPCSDEKTDSFPSSQMSRTKGQSQRTRGNLIFAGLTSVGDFTALVLTFSLFQISAVLAQWRRVVYRYCLKVFDFAGWEKVKKPAMPLVPSSAPLPSSMTTIAYLREQEILNIVYIGLLVIEVLMVLGVITMALVKRVKVNHQLKTIRSATTSAKCAPYHFAHADTEKTML